VSFFSCITCNKNNNSSQLELFLVFRRDGAQSRDESTTTAAFPGEAIAEATQINQQHDPRLIAGNAAVLGLFFTVVRESESSRGGSVQEPAGCLRGRQDAANNISDSTDRRISDDEGVAATTEGYAGCNVRFFGGFQNSGKEAAIATRG